MCNFCEMPTQIFLVFLNIVFKDESIYTRNTLTQASKNSRKPHLFPQKKFLSVFYAINIFTPSIISNREILIVRRENAFF